MGLTTKNNKLNKIKCKLIITTLIKLKLYFKNLKIKKLLKNQKNVITVISYKQELLKVIVALDVKININVENSVHRLTLMIMNGRLKLNQRTSNMKNISRELKNLLKKLKKTKNQL